MVRAWEYCLVRNGDGDLLSKIVGSIQAKQRIDELANAAVDISVCPTFCVSDGIGAVGCVGQLGKWTVSLVRINTAEVSTKLQIPGDLPFVPKRLAPSEIKAFAVAKYRHECNRYRAYPHDNRDDFEHKILLLSIANCSRLQKF
jgi:hypothetical protein